MFRTVAAITALLILPTLASAQEISTPQEQGTHVVVKGNTLWDLAEYYLGNPFLWPLIYEANTDKIQDPHWIYPGQIFVIPGLEAAQGQAQAGGAAAGAEPGQVPIQDVTVVQPGAQPQGGGRAVAGAVGNVPVCPGRGYRTIFWEGEDANRGCVLPIPTPAQRSAFYTDPETAVISGTTTNRTDILYAVPRGLVYSTPWLEEWEAPLQSVGTIARFADVDMEATPRERARFFEKLQIELNEGVDLRVGDLLQAFDVVRSEEELGQVVRPTGVLAVTAVEESGVVAMLSAEFDRVRLGQRLRMAPGYDFRPGISAQGVESSLTATLVGFAADRVVYGIGAVAFLDVGEAEGVGPGDEFSAYVNQGEGWSGAEAARLQVVVVNDSISSARIVTLSDPSLQTGATVRLVKKMQ